MEADDCYTEAERLLREVVKDLSEMLDGDLIPSYGPVAVDPALTRLIQARTLLGQGGALDGTLP